MRAVEVSSPPAAAHALWVRVTHWIATVSVAALAFSGVVILMAHPRLYWGDAGNDLTPALLELPISRNYKHGGYTPPAPFFESSSGPVSASRTFDIFNQNGWGRSLHFLAAWVLALTGAIYVFNGLATRHFRSAFLPASGELTAARLRREIEDHVRLRVRASSRGPRYGLLQKVAYGIVVFVAAPLMLLTGLTMAPAVTAAWPVLLRVFGGYQSARTIHFFAFLGIAAFVVIHVVMVVRSGLAAQLKGMILGR